MGPLTFDHKRTPTKDLVAGIGTSLAVHVLAFSSAFIFALIMPHKPFKPPYCTVNLVSLRDVGAGSSEPKGSPKAAEETDVPKNISNEGKSHQKSEAAAPIKRLTIDETAVKPESQIKKIEPKEVPVAPAKPQSLEAIEKNLDKLIERPKEVPHSSAASAHQAESQPKTAAQPPPAPAKAGNQSGTEKLARGTPTGTAEGGPKVVQWVALSGLLTEARPFPLLHSFITKESETRYDRNSSCPIRISGIWR